MKIAVSPSREGEDLRRSTSVNIDREDWPAPKHRSGTSDQPCHLNRSTWADSSVARRPFSRFSPVYRGERTEEKCERKRRVLHRPWTSSRSLVRLWYSRFPRQWTILSDRGPNRLSSRRTAESGVWVSHPLAMPETSSTLEIPDHSDRESSFCSERDGLTNLRARSPTPRLTCSPGRRTTNSPSGAFIPFVFLLDRRHLFSFDRREPLNAE